MGTPATPGTASEVARPSPGGWRTRRYDPLRGAVTPPPYRSAMTYLPLPPLPDHPDVVLRASSRRKKTAGAHWDGDRLVITFPVRHDPADRARLVDYFVTRMSRHRPHLHTSDADLWERACRLGDRYFDGLRAQSVRWSDRQHSLWGSCTMVTREIRISSRLRVAPSWVVDAVVVHELAHLLEAGHTARFRQLEERYPRRREADVFLAGYALGLGCDRTGDGGASGDGSCDEPAAADAGWEGAGLGGGTSGPSYPADRTC